MFYIILFFILIVVTVITLAFGLFQLLFRIIAQIRNKANPKQLTRLKRTALFFAVVMAINFGLIAISQFTASTPRIIDESGNTPANSIAELTELELNGRKQWISMRGWDKNAPVLLFWQVAPAARRWQQFVMNWQSLKSILWW